jgi:hypothetical protein
VKELLAHKPYAALPSLAKTKKVLDTIMNA